MPISLSKTDTFRLELKIDESVPEENRPYFEFAPLTGREQKTLAKELDDVTKNPSPFAIVANSFSLIKPFLVGWGNIVDKHDNVVLFDPEKIEDVIQYLEAQELAWKLFGYAPQLEELKNSESQSPLPTVKSVNPEPVKSVETP